MSTLCIQSVSRTVPILYRTCTYPIQMPQSNDTEHILVRVITIMMLAYWNDNLNLFTIVVEDVLCCI